MTHPDTTIAAGPVCASGGIAGLVLGNTGQTFLDKSQRAIRLSARQHVVSGVFFVFEAGDFATRFSIGIVSGNVVVIVVQVCQINRN